MDVFDAKGYSTVPKIRDIGGALLDELRTGSQSSDLQASINLDELLAKLESLDQRTAVQAINTLVCLFQIADIINTRCYFVRRIL